MVNQIKEVRVSGKSNPSSVAGSIAILIKDGFQVDLIAIGMAASYIQTKATAITRGFMAAAGIEVEFQPSFTETLVKGEQKTALRWNIRRKVGTEG